MHLSLTVSVCMRFPGRSFNEGGPCWVTVKRATTPRSPKRQRPSCHLQELDKISCLLCRSHSNWTRMKNRLLTQTQAAHPHTAVCVSVDVWVSHQKQNRLRLECFVFHSDCSSQLPLPSFIAFKPQFYGRSSLMDVHSVLTCMSGETTLLKKSVFVPSSGPEVVFHLLCLISAY